jgi:uncharacterized protein YdeI (YjbR/CyaY-like superfamily)
MNQKDMDRSLTVNCKDRKEWRFWLQNNHGTKKEVWVVYYKKHTKKASVPYDDAVEEAICFGWIDGQVKRIDEERYMQRFTPRTSKSRWSMQNIERAKKMIKLELMTEKGLLVFRDGMKNKRIIPSSKNFKVPSDFKKALAENKIALKNFKNFSPSARLHYVYWIDGAKTEKTRTKRIKKSLELIESNWKLAEAQKLI